MKRLVIVIYGVLALLLIVGTFVDYDITALLYHENSWFGEFMARFIYIPTFLVGYIGLFVVMRTVHQSNNVHKNVFLGLVLLFYVILTVVFVSVFTYSDDMIVVILLVLMNISAVGVTVCIPKDKLSVFHDLALLYLFVLVSEFLIVSLVKFLWGRERYFALDSVHDFSVWFIPQGVSSSNIYNSFPSGHTSAAAMMIVFVFLPLTIDSLRKYFLHVSIAVLVYVSLGALSRMLLGKHYLSDTVVSIMIVFSLFLYFYNVIRFNNKP